MIDERHEEMACLHALDLLEGEERRHFEGNLARKPEVQSLLRDLRQTSAALALLATPTPPPVELRARVLASVAAKALSASAPDVLPLPLRAFRRWGPWALAASFALSAGWLGLLYLTGQSEKELLHTQAELASLQLASARQQADVMRLLLEQQGSASRRQVAELRTELADRERRLGQLASDLRSQADLSRLKITALASLLENSPKALAVAVWDPNRQEGALKVEKLPPLAPHQDYQLWVVDPQYPNPVDGGVFTVDASTGEARLIFKARQSIGAVSAFAITLERKGGVPKAEGPFVLLGK